MVQEWTEGPSISTIDVNKVEGVDERARILHLSPPCQRRRRIKKKETVMYHETHSYSRHLRTESHLFGFDTGAAPFSITLAIPEPISIPVLRQLKIIPLPVRRREPALFFPEGLERILILTT